MLEVGQKAIDFQLPNECGEMISLSSFKGQKVILYFYPKDNTPGCTKQACAFASAYDAFKEMNAVIIGISKDSSKAHLNFKKKYDLPFILLSDIDHEVIEAYDVWKEKKLYGKTYMGIVRSTYVIDENGIITHALEKVNPEQNAAQVLELIKETL